MKKNNISVILNILIVLFVTIGSIFMFTGLKFMREATILESTKIGMFKFYTVDSNILMGIIAFIFVIYEILKIKGKIDNIPTLIYNLKLMATVGVTITFIITLIFLAPMYGFYEMYNNSNLFFHLIVPILSIISYIVFDKYDNKYIYAFYGLITMVLYSIYYTSNVLLHLENGNPTYKYDFYGFLRENINNIYIAIPLLFIFGYLISLLLVFLNKKLLK